MAAPVAVSRQVPVGYMIENGFSSLITFTQDPNAALWELEVQPPGISGGEVIDITTHHNSEYRTKRARTLKELKQFTVVAAYDPAIYETLLAQVNREDTWTITWPSDQTLAFFAVLTDVEFAPLIVGDFPQVTITIDPTQFDYDNCVEAGPVFAGTGTC